MLFTAKSSIFVYKSFYFGREMKKNKNYKAILKHYHWMYASALASIAILSLSCQLLIQNYLTNQISDTHLINYASKLRSDSQMLTKHALLMQQGYDMKDNSRDFNNIFQQWKTTHTSLRTGNNFLNIPPNGNKEIEELFGIIDGTFHEMVDACEHIRQLTATEQPDTLSTDALNPYVTQLLKYEKSYLLGMEMIVFDYDLISTEKVRFMKRMEWFLFVILIVCLVIEALVIFWPLYRRLSHAFEDLLDNTKASREMANRIQRIRTESMLAGETKERKRIASEIHDGIGQMLTALRMKVEMIGSHPENVATISDDVREMTTDIIKETRRICSELLPNVLEDFGLGAAIRDLCRSIQSNTSIQVDLQDELEENLLTKRKEVVVYRVLQEAVNNIVKHSRATQMRLQLEADAEMIYIHIADNGTGFHLDSEKIYEKRNSGMFGNGLVNMKERTEMLGGKFHINSILKKGTTIEIEIPLEYK